MISFFPHATFIFMTNNLGPIVLAKLQLQSEKIITSSMFNSNSGSHMHAD